MRHRSKNKPALMAVTQEIFDISCLVGPDGQDQSYCAFVGQVARAKWSGHKEAIHNTHKPAEEPDADASVQGLPRMDTEKSDNTRLNKITFKGVHNWNNQIHKDKECERPLIFVLN
ncbi:hypothetical protein J6590_068931 [Homalodisca vitripennis]|nr:hypothetical protein J6590_068931 [Homalodisca vitripennis]